MTHHTLFPAFQWKKRSISVNFTRLWHISILLFYLVSLVGVPASVVQAAPSALTCETFDVGWTDGAMIDNADWYSNNGLAINEGIGVAGSWGIGTSSNIFIWQSQGFSWADTSVSGVVLQLDFQTNDSSQFDDDRVGWQTTSTNVGSNYIFGVQLDNSGAHNRIEGYWDHVYNAGDDAGRPEIVSLDGLLAANSWYRLTAEFTKLTATSAQIDAELWSLDASGNPVSQIAGGTIDDTSTLGTASPAPEYFTTTTLYPAFKNYNSITGSADNTCYEILTGTPPVQHTLSVTNDGHGTVTLNPPGGIYDEDTVVTLTPAPDNGYEFDSWSGTNAGDLIDNGDGTWSITMTEDKDVAANFVAVPPVALTVNIVGQGSVTLDPDTSPYPVNTVVSLNAIPESGWYFAGWSGDLSGSANPESITMDTAKSVTATFSESAPPPAGTCEDFETGFTLGQVVGAHADWFDSGTGPVVTSGNGLVGSTGLAPGSSIFTWTAHPFNWNDPSFESITFSMDYQTDGSGNFDDDRMGWMTTDTSADSASFFGVQLDTTEDGGIVTYWRDDVGTRIQTPIVPLSGLPANTWYRLTTTITKLTGTSASIDVHLTQLDAAGDPTGTPYVGTLDDTSTWPDGTPIDSYFTPTSMWPAYKNYNSIVGAADNACFEIASSRFAFIVTTDWHTSDAYPNTDIAAKVGQIANWVNSPTPEMPAPEFMVITGDFPNLAETQEIIDDQLGSGFLWYPVIGNHEISDDIQNFYDIRDTMVPGLPNIVDTGPAGSLYTSYSFDYENSHFMIINPFWDGASDDHTVGGDIPAALDTWVDSDLAANDETHKFVFIHTPAYPNTRHVGEDLDANPANRDAFVATLNANNVETLFAGHTHYYEHDVAPEYPLGNLDQVTNGSLRSGGVPVTFTYVLVEGGTTTYRVYEWTGSAFSLYDQWTISSSEPIPSCYALTLNHTGFGATPSATPTNSVGCPEGEYLAGEPINLSGALPDSGWEIESWTGTSDNISTADTNSLIMPPGAHTAGVNYVFSGPSILVCESFNTYTPGSIIGTYPDWFDGGAGPVVTAGNGVAGTVGLGNANDIFTWTAHPFDWTAVDFVGVNLQADFQADASGNFDDDRVGWMITDVSAGSDNIFGVQLDPGGSGYNIEAYWDGDTFGDDGGRTSIADLPALSANGWYRLRAEITKLTATSASIYVSLTELDASGNPGTVVANGSIADTALLPNTTENEIPNPGYFTGSIWPAYKNYNAINGAFDNACYEVVTGTPPPQYTLTTQVVGDGSITLNPSGGTYYEGTSVQLTPVPGLGYQFDSWSGTNSGDLVDNGDGTWSITMTEDKDVTANFVAVPPVALTVNIVGQGSVTLDPDTGPYPANTVVSLHAIPESGWYFAGWSGDLSGSANPESITMTTAKSVTATFEVIPPADYYVDNTNPSCSDSGAGTLETPFCTIGRGAYLAVAGETVFVLHGTYAETVGVQNNGTEGNPITFQAGPSVTVTGNPAYGPASSGFSVNTKSYITIDGFNIYHTMGKGILAENSDHLTIKNNHVSYAGAETSSTTHQQGIVLRNTIQSTVTGNVTDHNSCIGIRLINNSDNNTVSNNVSFANASYIADPEVVISDAAGIELTGSSNNTVINNIVYGNEDSGINLYVNSTNVGSSYNLVIDNLSYGNGDHGIDNNNSPYNTIVGNTVHGNGTTGINFEGSTGSHHATVANNISAENGLTPPTGSFGGNLRVDALSVDGTTLDYDLFNRGSASVQIIWNDNSYTSLSDFQDAENSQEVNGLQGDPLFIAPVAPVLRSTGVQFNGSEVTGDYHLQALSPAIDSANSDAPNQPLTDLDGNPRMDDLDTPDTGAGTRTYDDRGAYEFQVSCFALTLSRTGEGSDLVATPVKSEICSADGQYEAGVFITLSGAAPTAGWQITGWTGTDDDASTDGTNTFTMPASAHTASVTYTQIEYTLTVNSDHGTVTKTPDQASYHLNDVVSLEATPETGWRFVNWTGSVSSTENPVDVTINENKVVTANYERITACVDINVVTGWNMVSVPVLASDMRLGVLFPDIFQSAYAYTGTYQAVGADESLSIGVGYWMYFNDPHTYQICGPVATNRQINVNTGWNMIGPFEDPVAVSSITSTPEGILAPTVYGYTSGYAIVATLQPGSGYWAFVSETGSLDLGASQTSSPAVQTQAGQCTLNWQASIQVTDSGKNGEHLWIGQGPSASDDLNDGCGEVRMPPKPPAGAFDARLVLPGGLDASHQDYRSSLNNQIEWRLEFQSGKQSGPFTFTWDPAALPDGNWRLQDSFGGVLVDLDMTSQTSYTLDGLELDRLSIHYEPVKTGFQLYLPLIKP